MKPKLHKFLFAPIFYIFLRPLILRNYRMREKGLLPDEWYWADTLAVHFGWCVTLESFWYDKENRVWK